MRKVLVCGASGFIGRNIFEELSLRPDLNVYGTYLRRRFLDSNKLLRADLKDKEWALAVTRGMDIVINAAAVTDGSGAVFSNPCKYIADNTRINTNIIESSFENNVGQFILFSCSILYPKKNTGLVKEESVDLSEIHPKYFMFAQIKAFAEDMCNFFSRFGKTKFTAIRHSNIYGPYDKFDVRGHVFAATLAKVMKNNEVTLWGDGSEVRDFLHISDLTDFVYKALDQCDQYDVFNVGSGKSLSVGELAKKINFISERNLPIKFDLTRSSIHTNIVLDTSKALKILGWQPTVDIDEGIRQTIDWYLKNNGDQIER